MERPYLVMFKYSINVLHVSRSFHSINCTNYIFKTCIGAESNVGPHFSETSPNFEYNSE